MRSQRKWNTVYCVLAALTLLLIPTTLYAVDFGISVAERSVTTYQNRLVDLQQLKIHRKDFEGPINVNIEIDPPDGGVDAYVSSSPNLRGGSQRRSETDIMISTAHDVENGSYSVTVTATGIVNGEMRTRIAVFVVNVVRKDTFDASLNPTHLIIPQGGSGTTQVTLLDKDGYDTPPSFALVGRHAFSFNWDMTGDVKVGMTRSDMFTGGWRYFADPGEDGVSNSTLIIMVPPDTPTGDYILNLEVTRHFDVQLNIPGTRYKAARTSSASRINRRKLRFKVTVTAPLDEEPQVSLPEPKKQEPEVSVGETPDIMIATDSAQLCDFREANPQSSTSMPVNYGDATQDSPATLTIETTAQVPEGAAGTNATPMQNQQVKIIDEATANTALPGQGSTKSQAGHDEGPTQGTTNARGELNLPVSDSTQQHLRVSVDTTSQTSLVVEANEALPAGLEETVSDSLLANGRQFKVLTVPKSQESDVKAALEAAGIPWDDNHCRQKLEAANDPLYQGAGAWQQDFDNQWAIKRIGFNDQSTSAWGNLGENPQPVTIAIIDTGLDWNHLDFDWRNLWLNPNEVPDNGIDDDKNGYIDDIIGWDFYGKHNKPWDHDGHGTLVSGIIAATSNNEIGIAGINPHARIMVLKALNSFGHSRASYLAKAIVYAADNGARIINLSVGGDNTTAIESAAIEYAISKGVLLVVAAGNEGRNTENYGIASIKEVVTVGATNQANERAAFSNWGAAIDLVAPGTDILSLRARRTDTMRGLPGLDYASGANYVGADKRYYRTSGTSFAAPLVSGVASLLMSQRPELTAGEVTQILLQSADDVDSPGVDQYSGYGIVNATRALATDARFFVTANIDRVEITQGARGPVVQVIGSASADSFRSATLSIGEGADPQKWKPVIQLQSGVSRGLIGEIDAQTLRDSKLWIIRLVVEHKSGVKREHRLNLKLG